MPWRSSIKPFSMILIQFRMMCVVNVQLNDMVGFVTHHTLEFERTMFHFFDSNFQKCQRHRSPLHKQKLQKLLFHWCLRSEIHLLVLFDWGIRLQIQQDRIVNLKSKIHSIIRQLRKRALLILMILH